MDTFYPGRMTARDLADILALSKYKGIARLLR